MIEPGPAVVDDEREGVLVLRTHVDEVDVQAVDLGHELRQGVQLLLDLAPVVIGGPVAREFLHRRQRHTLRFVRHGLALRPLGGLDATAQVVQSFVGHLDVEGADFGGGLDRTAHDELLSSRSDLNPARTSAV